MNREEVYFMGTRELFKDYFLEITNMVDILAKYVNAYRLLIGSAGELNSIALARKSDVKDALKRVNELGKLIDCLIKSLDCAQCTYIDYLKLRASFIEAQATRDIILTEIEQELLFQNANRIVNSDIDITKNVTVNKNGGNKDGGNKDGGNK